MFFTALKVFSEAFGLSAMHYSYYIDTSARIVHVDAGWDVFAQENSGDDCFAQSVLGERLHRFVSGDLTKMWLDILFQRAFFLGRPSRHEYRCDAPDKLRRFEMIVEKSDNDTVQFSHRLLVEEPMQSNIMFLTSDRRGSQVTRCSFCNSFLLNGEWYDAADLNCSDTFDAKYVVCSDCMRSLRDAG